ncbi:ferritin-like domain-containing protein [Pseudorhodoferax sp.]|uniref:ferritin-like domain-containing protein n=1 Tax=Pseudorhodoferax sp. TaxID=1993553 RepID=UPI0039E22723
MTDDCSLPTIDTEALGLDQGGLLLVRHALDALPPGAALRVRGRAPGWAVHLRAWCRQQGHGLRFEDEAGAAIVTRHGQADGRWRGALPTGHALLAPGAEPLPEALPEWGLAARGALVEAGGPRLAFALHRREEIWAATAGELYRQAAAAQWDPETAIDWNAEFTLAPAIEAAVVQVMAYLVENENAALVLPARHLGQVHPHYREVMQLLALQCADEARHVEVFTRRATLRGEPRVLSTAGGQASLNSLFEAPDFSTAVLLLSVLGEGSFVQLLHFLHDHGPDPVTRQITRLAARDEARHVAFAMAHLEYRLAAQPGQIDRLRNAIEERYDALAGTAGLNQEVLDALVLLAAGALTPQALGRGHAAVQQLQRDMAAGRKARLLRLGFPAGEAQRLAALHTRNFM